MNTAIYGEPDPRDLRNANFAIRHIQMLMQNDNHTHQKHVWITELREINTKQGRPDECDF